MSDERVISINIVGARGRMGTALIREVIGSDHLTLGAVVDRSGGAGTGLDAGTLANLPEIGIRVTDSLTARRGSVTVDFSLPSATDQNIERCVSDGVPLVLGTTGISETTEARLNEAAQSIPVVFAANFSVGVTLLTQLAGIAAQALGEDFHAEIFELHHRHKRDSPSGTALRIGQAVAAATERKFSDVVVTDRSGLNRQRQDQEIGVYGMRGGDSVGEHTLMLIGEGERLELTHRARDRAIFARGALRAARWVCDREPGLYDMVDVLGLSALYE